MTSIWSAPVDDPAVVDGAGVAVDDGGAGGAVVTGGAKVVGTGGVVAGAVVAGVVVAGAVVGGSAGVVEGNESTAEIAAGLSDPEHPAIALADINKLTPITDLNAVCMAPT